MQEIRRIGEATREFHQALRRTADTISEVLVGVFLLILSLAVLVLRFGSYRFPSDNPASEVPSATKVARR